MTPVKGAAIKELINMYEDIAKQEQPRLSTRKHADTTTEVPSSPITTLPFSPRGDSRPAPQKQQDEDLKRALNPIFKEVLKITHEYELHEAGWL